MDNFYSKYFYKVSLADYKTIEKEWNFKWDKNLYDINQHRIYYIEKGTGELVTNKKTIFLQEGFIYLIPAFTVKESRCTSEMTHYYIHFQNDQDFFKLYSVTETNFEPIKITPFLFELINKIKESYQDTSPEGTMIVQGCMNILLAEFFKKNAHDIGTNNKYYKIIDYIDKNYTKKITVKELADIVNLNTVYFSNSFKEIYNVTPKQYLVNKKLMQAQIFLINTDYSIKEISNMLGFENQYYFSDIFKQKNSLSPQKFRKCFKQLK